MNDQRAIAMHYVPGLEVVDDPTYVKVLQEDWNKRSDIDATLYTCAVSNASEDIVKETGSTDYHLHFTPPGLGKTTKRKGYEVLEYGCGIGRMTQFISRDVSHVTAVDISSRQLERARVRLKNISNIDLVLTDGLSLDGVKTGKYNYIFSYLVFQHIGSKSTIKTILEEFDRVLKKGGRMKLQFRDIPIPEDNNLGNTWHGSQIGEEFLTDFAKSKDWKVESITGQGTEYLWVELRRK